MLLPERLVAKEAHVAGDASGRYKLRKGVSHVQSDCDWTGKECIGRGRRKTQKALQLRPGQAGVSCPHQCFPHSVPVTVFHVLRITIAIVEQERGLASARQSRSRIGAARIVQRITDKRDSGSETNFAIGLISAAEVLQLVGEENIQHRINHVPRCLFRQKEPTNIIVVESRRRPRRRRGGTQIVTKAITKRSRRWSRRRCRTCAGYFQIYEAAGRAHVKGRVTKRFGIADLGGCWWTSSQPANDCKTR